MATLTENVKRVTDALDDIKSSIIAKGQTPSGRCETFSSAIDNIETGTDVSDTTAVADDVLSGKNFYLSNGTKTSGNLTDNKGDYVSIEPQPYSIMYEPPYFAVDKKMCIDETTRLFYVEGFGDAIKGDVRAGKTFTSDEGFKITGTLETTDTSDTTATEYNVEMGKVFHLANGSPATGKCENVTESGLDLYADEITDNKVVSTLHIVPTPGEHATAPIMLGNGGEVRLNISDIKQTKTVTLTEATQTITADEGKILESVIVPPGSGGGKKCVSGKFDTVAGTDKYVKCGFEPSMIMVSSISAKGTIASTDTSVYVKNATLEKHSFYRTTSVAQETNANANLRFTVDSNGFYYRSRYTNSDVYYMAIE